MGPKPWMAAVAFSRRAVEVLVASPGGLFSIIFPAIVGLLVERGMEIDDVYIYIYIVGRDGRVEKKGNVAECFVHMCTVSRHLRETCCMQSRGFTWFGCTSILSILM